MPEGSKLPYMPLFSSFMDETRRLKDSDFRCLLQAMSDYFFQGIEPEENDTDIWIYAFDAQKEKLDRTKQRYIEKCGKNADNVKKRWKQQHTDDTTVYDGIQPNTTDTTVYDGYQTEYKSKSETETEEEVLLLLPLQPEGVPYDRELSRVVDEYTRQIGELPGGSARETFMRYYGNIGADAMIEAIRYTNTQQPKNSWTYLMTVLDELEKAGVHDADTARANITGNIRRFKKNNSLIDRNQYDNSPQPQGNPFEDYATR